MTASVTGFEGSTPCKPGTLMGASCNALRAKHFNPGLRDLTFAYLGDSRTGPGATSPINTAVLTKTLAAIVKRKPDFILFAGDMGRNGSAKTLGQFVGIVKKTVKGTPFFVIPGNHEYYGDAKLTEYLKIIGGPNFLIRIPEFNFRLYALNDVLTAGTATGREEYGFRQFVSQRANGHLLNISLSTLHASLANTKGKNTIFAIHTPPFMNHWSNAFVKPAGPKVLFTRGRKQFVGIADKNAKYVLSSHVHVKSTMAGIIKRGSTQYIISGNAGAPKAPLLKPFNAKTPTTAGSKTQNEFRNGVANYVFFTVTPNSIKSHVFMV